MRPATVYAAAARDVFELARVLRERAHQRQRVVKHERVHAIASRRQAAQHRDVELLAVVRDENVGADKLAEPTENVGERRGGCYVSICISVNLRGARRNRSVWIHQGVKAIHDLAIHNSRGADLHDAAGRDVRIRRLEVERHITRQPGIELAGVNQLEALEERQAVDVSKHDVTVWPRRCATQTRGCEHTAQRDLNAAAAFDCDALLTGNCVFELFREPHGLGHLRGIGQLVVPFLERVAIRADALRQQLVHDRLQRAVGARQRAQVFDLIDQAPQLLRVGIVRGTTARERAHGAEKVVARLVERRLDLLQEVLRQDAARERLERDGVRRKANDSQRGDDVSDDVIFHERAAAREPAGNSGAEQPPFEILAHAMLSIQDCRVALGAEVVDQPRRLFMLIAERVGGDFVR